MTSQKIQDPFVWSRVREIQCNPLFDLLCLLWPAELTFSLFLSQINQSFTDLYISIANPSREARQLGWASCLASAGRVTLVGGTTFLHINALACLTGTTLGVASVTHCLNFGFKAEIRIEEVKVHSAKPTVVDWTRETQRKRHICAFD